MEMNVRKYKQVSLCRFIKAFLIKNIYYFFIDNDREGIIEQVYDERINLIYADIEYR